MLVLSEQLEYFLAMPFSRRSLGLEARIFGRSLNGALAQKPLRARVSEPRYFDTLCHCPKLILQRRQTSPSVLG
jgi:hypothetical protein